MNWLLLFPHEARHRLLLQGDSHANHSWFLLAASDVSLPSFFSFAELVRCLILKELLDRGVWENWVLPRPADTEHMGEN